MNSSAHASRRSLIALDALNFFLADVAGGVGPFLVVWMAGSLSWSADRIGIVMFVAGVVPLAVQAPAGAWVDAAREKRLLIVGGCIGIAVACIAMVRFPVFGVVVAAQSMIGVCAAVLGPSVAAISLGLVGRKLLAPRLGRNASVSAAGNVVLTLAMGGIATLAGESAIFLFVALLALATLASALAIRHGEINAAAARGADTDASSVSIQGVRTILADRRLLVFAVCAIGFHFSNASLLTLVSQLFAHDPRSQHQAALYLSAGVAMTQLVMVPLGIVVGRYANRFPRKPVYAIAFAVLPLRCFLYLVSHDPRWLVALELLDGVAAGVFGVMQILVVADLTRGTGRFNLAQGIIATAVGIGAAASNLLAGYLARGFDDDTAFMVMGAIALGALALFMVAMPETSASCKELRPRLVA